MCKHDDVCIHPDNICDGVINCLNGADDERLCDSLTCPRHCSCLDNIVSCTQFTERIYTDNTPHNVKAIILIRLLLPIKPAMFSRFSNLLFLNMSGCYFESIYLFSKMFNRLTSLKILDLSYTNIRDLPILAFHPMLNLMHINFVGCKIKQLFPNIFPNSANLQTMNMNMLSIEIVHSNAFCQLYHLRKLNISDNLITNIADGTFNCLQNLTVLDVSNNAILHIDKSISIHVVYVDTISHCCHIPLASECVYIKINLKYKHKCTNILSGSLVLRYTGFVIGILIILLALTSIVCKHVYCHQTKDSVFCNNLSLSDGFLGCYFLLISILDIYYDDEFIKLNDPRLIQLICRIVGILPVLSMVMSTTICFLVAVQKLIATKYYFTKKYINVHSLRIQHTLLAITWIFWFLVILIYPTFSTPDSLLCFPPYATTNNGIANVMTVTIFIIYGGVIFIVTCGIYFQIMSYIKSVMKIRTEPSQKKIIYTRVIKKTMMVLSTNIISLLTNSFVIINGLLSNSNDNYVNKLLLFSILPMNAIVNPFIYNFWQLLQHHQ